MGEDQGSTTPVKKEDQRWSFTIISAIGVALRLLCFSTLGDSLEGRVELSSPLSSFELVEDGVAFLKQGISPYAGDSIHAQPIVLSFFALLSTLPRWYTVGFFVFMDVLSAYLLSKTTEKITKDVDPVKVAACFLLNPVTIASCSVCSLSVLTNLILIFYIWSFTNSQLSFVLQIICLGSLLLSSVALGILGHFTVYHLVLIGSTFLRFKEANQRIRSLAIVLGTFLGCCLLNFAVNNFNWDFIEDTYLFMYYVDDLTPNVGVFWYFFTQVFEHFRFFYISIFQINLLVYMIPLYLTVRNDTNLHLIISMLLITVFSPYPCLNDAAVYMALLPTLDKYWKEPMRFVLPIACSVVSCVVLMPIMWHMWIMSGSGNANFYFAVTIIYNLAQVYLLGDLLFAYFRKEAVAVAGDFITPKTSFIFN